MSSCKREIQHNQVYCRSNPHPHPPYAPPYSSHVLRMTLQLLNGFEKKNISIQKAMQAFKCSKKLPFELKTVTKTTSPNTETPYKYIYHWTSYYRQSRHVWKSRETHFTTISHVNLTSCEIQVKNIGAFFVWKFSCEFHLRRFCLCMYIANVHIIGHYLTWIIPNAFL